MNSETLKQEISSNPSRPMLLIGVTSILIAIVVFQSFELRRLEGYAQGLSQIKTVKAAGATSQATTLSAPVRQAPSGLPSQVGGC